MALGDDGIATGLGVLAFGWSDGPLAIIPWFANPFWFLGLVFLMLRIFWAAAVLSSAAIGCAYSAMALFPHSASLEGYEWWLASMVMLAVGSFAALAWRVPPRAERGGFCQVGETES